MDYTRFYEELIWLRKVFEFDVIVGFLVWSWLFYSFLSLFRVNTKRFVKAFDHWACRSIVYYGLIYFIFTVIQMILVPLIKEYPYREVPIEYQILYYISPLICLIATQIFRWKHVRKYFIYRLIPLMVLTLGMERYVIITTSLHRDYLPEGFNESIFKGIPWTAVLNGLATKLLVFILFTLLIIILQYSYNYLKTIYENRRYST